MKVSASLKLGVPSRYFLGLRVCNQVFQLRRLCGIVSKTKVITCERRVVTCSKTLSQNLTGGTEEDHKKTYMRICDDRAETIIWDL